MDSANPPSLSRSLSELDLAPDWASQLRDKPAEQVVWGQVTVHDRGPRREGRGGPPRRDDRGGPRPGGPGPRGPGGPPGMRSGPGGPPRGDRGPRRDGPPRPDQRSGPREFGRDGQGAPRGGRRDDRGPGRFPRPDDRPAFVPPARGWLAIVLPEPTGVENLTIQIKSTGRAYQVFDLARLFLSKSERVRIRFEPLRGEKVSPLILCAPDGSLWLTRDEARRHFSRAGLLSHYFSEEKISVDPPKGAFTTVAICGFSGTVLGPPNFHGYQRTIIQLHQDRFKNMPLDRYKSRIRMERDEEAVKKWMEAQSTQTHYTLLDAGENSPTFNNAEDAARFLLETREAEILAEAPSATVPGNLDFSLLSPGLVTLFRDALDRQRRFPLELVQELCRQFEGQGLRFFKENKKETFVSRSRPRPLDAGVSVSPRVKVIVEFIRQHPLCTYKEVVVGLVPQGASLLEPAPAAAAAETTAEQAAEATPPASEPADTQEIHEPTVTETPVSDAAPAESAATETPAPETEGPSEADREGIALLQDLRWLIREGYVTEFANGQLRVVERHEKPIILQAPKRLRLFGRAFTLWTRPYLPSRPPRWLRLPARSFTLWTKAALAIPAHPPIEPAPAPEPEAPAPVPVAEPVPAAETPVGEAPAIDTTVVEAAVVETQPNETATDAPAPASGTPGEI